MIGTFKASDDLPVNLRQCSLSTLKQGEKYYIKKSFSGQSYFAECEFIEVARKRVVGRVVRNFVSSGHSVPQDFKNGNIVSMKPDQCCLYGKRNHEGWDHCFWFKDLTSEIL